MIRKNRFAKNPDEYVIIKIAMLFNINVELRAKPRFVLHK